jgi:ankyrin repeat protein
MRAMHLRDLVGPVVVAAATFACCTMPAIHAQGTTPASDALRKVAVASTALSTSTLTRGLSSERANPSDAIGFFGVARALAPWSVLGVRMGAEMQGNLLAWAIASRQSTVANWLIDWKFNPNAKDSDGMTPLLHAVAAENWSLAARLLTEGANPNDAGPRGVTPLMVAASVGNLDAIDALLQQGADINAADAVSRGPVHYALTARNRAALEYLLEQNARVDVTTSDGRDVFAFAADIKDWSLMAPVLEKFKSRRWDRLARRVLAEVMAAKDTTHMRLLLTKHAGPATAEGCKDPLLAYAAVRNDLDTARMLLEAGADPNTVVNAPAEKGLLDFVPHKVLRHYLTSEKGMTALSIAAGMGHDAMLRLLLDHGAQKNRATQSKHRLIPLYFAAWGNHVKCLQALIDNAPSPSEMRIEISLGAQRAVVYKNGVPIVRTDISSGRADFPTQTGEFVVTDKKRTHMSSIYKVPMPYFMRLSCKDFGMHEGYVPGYPDSHGCIRLPQETARKLFREVPIGTLVVIR